MRILWSGRSHQLCPWLNKPREGKESQEETYDAYVGPIALRKESRQDHDHFPNKAVLHASRYGWHLLRVLCRVCF